MGTKPVVIREKKPEWLKVRAPVGERYLKIKNLLKDLNLSTVCQEARCPNMGECWSGGTATVMLMGDTCTRGCRFCSVKTGNPRGALDSKEPENMAYALEQMNLDYVVLTSVDRDDLEDGGADHFARTVETIKARDPHLIVEVLTPDFSGVEKNIRRIVNAKPEVFAHNIETVERLTPTVRDPRASYDLSMSVLNTVKEMDATRYTKSSLMLGLGETDEEVLQTLEDLRSVNCDIVTFGQYLRPTKYKLKVQEYITPEKFAYWKSSAEKMGFLYVASGPLVRSSYKAGEFFMKSVIENK